VSVITSKISVLIVNQSSSLLLNRSQDCLEPPGDYGGLEEVSTIPADPRLGPQSAPRRESDLGTLSHPASKGSSDGWGSAII